MKPLLEVTNLRVGFRKGSRHDIVVEDLSFVLDRAKVLGIAGESGSGKTLSVLSLMGLLPPGAKILGGDILFRPEPGREINLGRAREAVLRSVRGKEISMIFQEPMTALNPVKSCGMQAAEPLRIHAGNTPGQARKKVLSLFEEVRLPGPERIFSSYPHELSGGQRQRVMIAMALSTRPALLIADEPTTALDVTVQRSILTMLLDLQKKYGMAMIFISHDLDILKELADDAVIMHQGRMVESGSARTVLFNPDHRYTRGLIACKPPMTGRYRRLPVIGDFLAGEEPGQKQVKVEKVTEKERNAIHAGLYSANPLLEVRGLKTSFTRKTGLFSTSKEQVHAVNDVSFDVYRGETLGLVGESGCGKTTLGRSLVQLISQSSGKITYDGVRLDSLRNPDLLKIRRKIQLIFQDPFSSLNPRITVGDAITEPLKAHGYLRDDQERKRKALEMFERVKLDPGSFYRFPHEFSGGQRQRVALARALVINPEFVVCDESVSSLDLSVQAEILNLLNELKQEMGLTYLFISHDLSVVRYMSDRILVMYEGKLVESGEADELFNNPSAGYTKNLIASIPGQQVQSY